MDRREEEDMLRSVALQNAQSILAARQRAEEELLDAKEKLETKTQELAQSLAMMRATLESTTDAILVTDNSGFVTGFNAKYVDLWQIPRQLLNLRQHRPLLDVISMQFPDPASFLLRVDEIYASALAESVDLLELIDGRVIERFSKIQTVDGYNTGRVWSFSDMTEQRRAEEAMRDESRALELLNQTGITIASKLERQVLAQEVTDAATQLSGAQFGAFFYFTSDHTGKDLMLYALSGMPCEAFEQLGQPPALPLFATTINRRAAIRCDDVQTDSRYEKLRQHFGMPRNYPQVRSYLAVPVMTSSGKSIGSLLFGHSKTGMFSDKTERIVRGVAAQAAVAIDNARLYEAAQKSAQERELLLEGERLARAEVERISCLKDEFLATLSHELRTPLNSILGWTEILRIGERSEADLDKGLEIIERNSLAQAQLIEDLLDMNRIISGQMRLDIQQVFPATAIEAAIETVRPAANAKNINLEKIIDPAAGPISGDASRLQQIIWNVLSNAIKFTPKNGNVQIVLERVKSHIEIIVADTGAGIAAEFLPYIFDRFRQADGSSTRRHGGLGLGLSIVKPLVELHGGTVSVESAGLGLGTTFRVHLPVTAIRRDPNAAHPTAHKDTAVEFMPLDLTGIKVLVVDDEADARDLLARVLGDCHADVMSTGLVAEALLMIENERPHVLVSDIGMPDMDGFELLKRVRALGQSRGGNLPAIALTAFARSEDRTRALRAGFLVHVAKPVNPSELVATVATSVGRTGQTDL